MIPFLDVEPRMPGKLPQPPEAGETGGDAPARGFSSFLAGTVTEEGATEVASDGDALVPAADTLAPELAMREGEEIAIPRTLPEKASNSAEAALSKLTRPETDPEMVLPQRRAAGLDETTLPTRAAQVWTALSEGERPVPAAQPAAIGKPPTASLTVAGEEQPRMQPHASVPDRGTQPRGLSEEGVELPNRSLPHQAVEQVPRSQDGRVPGLVTAQSRLSERQTGLFEAPRTSPSEKSSQRETVPPAASVHQFERTGVPVQGPVAAVATQPAAPPEGKVALAQLDAVEAGARLADPAIGIGATSVERTNASGSIFTTVSAQAAAPETARHAASQMAIAITQNGGRSTEIALNPEELGRVRMSLSAVETSVSLTVFADRPETVDLLRRHMDILAQEFRALGYADIQFSFSGSSQRDAEQSDVLQGSAEAVDQVETVMAADDVPLITESGVDLRL